MTREIDERVVEMRFDNKEFEARTKETMSSLDRLKASLDMNAAAKNFNAIDTAARKVSFEGISEGIDMLTKRFSTFGIMGMRVIENLTDSMMGIVHKGINFVNDSIVSGGVKRAMNIENAHFQLQALLKDEEQVQMIMGKANDSVDGTAYSYDVAAKAASQFAASGIRDADQMESSLNAIANATAAVNGDYESMARIFTQTAGQGRLMGDQLLQLSVRGMNAAAMMTEYYQDVKGMTGLTEEKLRKMVSDGKVSFKDFVNAMNHTYEGAAKRANETFNGAYKNVQAALARIGAGFISPLIEQNGALVDLFNALRVQINAVKNELVFSDKLQNTEALSKRVTDSLIEFLKKVKDIIDNTDVVTFTKAFVNVLDGLWNILKGIYTVIEPIGKAFKSVFLQGIDTQRIYDISEAFKNFTSNIKLNEGEMWSLQMLFTGIFKVVELLKDGIVGLLKAFIPAEEDVGRLRFSLSSIAYNIGLALTKFTKWVRTSPRINKAFNLLKKAAAAFTKTLISVVSWIRNLTSKARDYKPLQDAFEAIANVFSALKEAAMPILEKLIDKLGLFKDAAVEAAPDIASQALKWFTDRLNDLAEAIRNFDPSKIKKKFEEIKQSVEDFLGLKTGNKGFDTFVENAKKFSSDLTDAFTFDNLKTNLGNAKDSITGFTSWISEKLAPITKNIKAGDIITLISAIITFMSFKKLSKSVKKFSSIGDSIKDVLGAVKTTLVLYQKQIKSESLLNIAKAIALLAASIVLLSFADLQGAIVGASLLAILFYTIAKLFDGMKVFTERHKETPDVLNTFAKKAGKALINLSKAVNKVAIGVMITMFANAILKIVAAILAVGAAYEKNPQMILNGGEIVGKIVLVMIAIIAGISLLGKYVIASAPFMAAIAGVILSVTFSIYLCVAAINKLFEIQVPRDIGTRMSILVTLFAGFGALLIVIGKAAQLSGGHTFNSIKALLAISGSLFLLVLSLDKLFKLEIPRDWFPKLLIFAGLIAGLTKVMEAISNASVGDNKKSIKAFGTLLGLSVFLFALVGALTLLSKLNPSKLILPALELGFLLAVLGGVLEGAGSIQSKEALKGISGMAVAIGAIVAAIMILSLVNWKDAVPAVLELSAVMYVLGEVFKKLGGMETDKLEGEVLSMAAVIAIIGGCLYLLAQVKDWASMLSAAASLSGVMYVLSKSFEVIGESKAWNKDKIKSFGAAVTGLMVIATAIGLVAYYNNWDSLLAAGASISAVLYVFSDAMSTISSKTGLKEEKAKVFLKCSLAIVAIGAALALAATQRWDSLLAAAAAISIVLGTLTGVMMVITKMPPMSKGQFVNIELIIAAIGEISLILGTLAYFTTDANKLIAVAEGISMSLLSLAGVFAVLSLIGNGAGASIEALAIFDVFIASLMGIIGGMGWIVNQLGGKDAVDAGAEALIAVGRGIGGLVREILTGLGEGIGGILSGVGKGLEDFTNSAKVFFDYMKSIGPETLEGIKYMSEGIILLTAASFISGIESFMGMAFSFTALGQQLSGFAESASVFFDKLDVIDAAKLEATDNLGNMILSLTKATIINGLTSFMGVFAGKSMTLSGFGEELASFGPSIQTFADSVKDLDNESVQKAADAAQIMAAFASANMPRTGGFLQQLIGEKMTLGTFGENLESFGKAMVSFSTAVSAEGAINQEAIQAAATSAGIMSELANGLPKKPDTINAWFTGATMTLGEFGMNLLAFGGSLVGYSKAITADGGIDTDAIESSKNAAQIMVDLSNSLGTESSWWDKTFGKGNKESLTTFGENLKSFGENLAAYCESIKDVSTAKMSSVTIQLNKMAEFAVAVKDLDADSMSEFLKMTQEINNSDFSKLSEKVKDMTALEGTVGSIMAGLVKKESEIVKQGHASRGAYLSGISSDYSTAIATGETLGSKVLEGITKKQEEFKMAGQANADAYYSSIFDYDSDISIEELTGDKVTSPILDKLTNSDLDFSEAGVGNLESYISGLGLSESDTQEITDSINNPLLDGLSGDLTDFSNIGAGNIKEYASGLLSKKPDVINSAKDIGAGALDKLNGFVSDFNKSGVNSATGYTNGLNSMIQKAGQAGASLGSTTLKALNRTLEIKSPSRKMGESGRFAGLGFVNYLLDTVKMAYEAGETLGDSTISGVNGSISKISQVLYDGIDYDPTITPHVDLSDVMSSSEEINGLFNDSIYTTSLKARGISSYIAANGFGGSKLIHNGEDLSNSSNSNNNVTNNNTFNINGANDPREVANEVSRILQRQVERRESTWA